MLNFLHSPCCVEENVQISVHFTGTGEFLQKTSGYALLPLHVTANITESYERKVL